MTGFNMTSKLLLPMFVTAKINGNYLSCGCPGKDNPGPVGRASLSGSGTEKSSSPGLRYFPPLHLRRGLMTLPEATDPFGI